MKATQGNLRIDQGYTLKDTEYHGKFSDCASGETCQNCGLFITNVAIVEGNNDKKTYRIGMDCASTLTTLDPSELKQAKKMLLREVKFRKFLATECKTIVKGKDDNATWAYKKELNEWSSFFSWRWFSFEKYSNLINKFNIKIVFDNN